MQEFPKEKVLKEATVIFLRNAIGHNGQVLLAVKASKIGAGKWNGAGGGRESGESREECAVRETREELGITALPSDLKKIAICYFLNHKRDRTSFTVRVDMYELWNWVGTPSASAELLTPTWFPLDEIPILGLMPADCVWLPVALRGEKIIVSAEYTPYQEGLIGEVQMTSVDDFDCD